MPIEARKNLSLYCTDAEWEALLKGYPMLADYAKLSPLLRQALTTYGLKETPGPDSTPAIDTMIAFLGDDAGPVRSDNEAWCSIWMAWVFKQQKQRLPAAPSWSFSWLRVPGGVPVPIGQMQMGDLAVFGRNEWAKTFGHPMFVIQLETYGHGWPFVHGIGGNQQDEVSVIAKSMKNLIGVVRPVMTQPPTA